MDNNNKDTVSKVLLVRELNEKGYREKVIRMITGLNQSYINKIINRKIHKYVDEEQEIELDEKTKARLNAANMILGLSEINTSDLNQDIMYIKLLKFFLVEKEEIHKLYNHWSKNKINRYLLKKDIDILDFDSMLLGIDKETYLDLIIDFFIER